MFHKQKAAIAGNIIKLSKYSKILKQLMEMQSAEDLYSAYIFRFCRFQK